MNSVGKRWIGRDQRSHEMINSSDDLYALRCIAVWCFFFSSRRRHTRFDCDWSSDVCSSDLAPIVDLIERGPDAGKGVQRQGESDADVDNAELAVRHRAEADEEQDHRHGEKEIGRASCRERV